MQHRLSTLVAYLERRWSLSRVKSNATKALLNVDLLADTQDKAETEPDADVPETVTTKTFTIRLRPQHSEKLSEKVQLKSTNNSISVNNYRSTTHANAQIDLSLSAYLKNLFNENGGIVTDGKGKQKIRKSSKKGTPQAESMVSSSNETTKATKDGESKFL